MGLAPASASEHLKVLRKTGLLTMEARHRHRLYSTDPEALEEVRAHLGAVARGEA